MRALLAIAVLCLVASAADARPRHHHRHGLHAHSQHHQVHRHHRRAKYARHHRRPRAVAAAPSIGGRPAHCPRRWCGCWMMMRKGLGDTGLWVARAWARLGTAASHPAPGVVIVWPHHVGEITAVLGNGMVRVISGNDGNRVRDRVRSLRGVIALRHV